MFQNCEPPHIRRARCELLRYYIQHIVSIKFDLLAQLRGLQLFRVHFKAYTRQNQSDDSKIFGDLSHQGGHKLRIQFS